MESNRKTDCITATSNDSQNDRNWGNKSSTEGQRNGVGPSCLGMSRPPGVGVIPPRSTLSFSTTSINDMPTRLDLGLVFPPSTSQDDPSRLTGGTISLTSSRSLDDLPSRSSGGIIFPTSSTIENNPPTGLSGGSTFSDPISSTSLNKSPESSDPPTSRERLPESSTSQFTTFVRYTTDPIGTTDITSIGVPSDTSGIASAKSGLRNAGAVAGAVISILFLIIIIGFLLHRRRVRLRNRIAPSAQYMAEYGDRPLSRGWIFFGRRGTSQNPDISHRPIAPEKGKSQWLIQEPEMRESQGLTNGRSPSSIGAAAGHSPALDDLFDHNFRP